MHQHTGNWSGKTVGSAIGRLADGEKKLLLADLPGAYSLEPESFEEETTRDFLIFGSPSAVLYVCGACSLERNLIFFLQIAEFCENMIVCVNMTDELKKAGKTLDPALLEARLGVPVFPVSAKKKTGLKKLKNALFSAVETRGTPPRTPVYDEKIESALSLLIPRAASLDCGISPRGTAIRFLCGDRAFCRTLKEQMPQKAEKIEALAADANEIASSLGGNLRESIASVLASTAEEIAAACTTAEKTPSAPQAKNRADRILTHKVFAYPIMFLLLVLIFWITVSAANVPSDALSALFSRLEVHLLTLLSALHFPERLTELLVFGVYRVVTWIIAVMLPPMAIFFPMFTLLEDSGYLPRIAFNLDRAFCACGACGKQALTMCMGYGCNAVGVAGCKIIGSERERLIAVFTNVFSPCNGRFPILIAVIAMFAGSLSGFVRALLLSGMIAFSVLITFGVSKLLSCTFLKGKASSFLLELPPYRMPRIGSVIVRSLLDRTLFVLLRAVTVAAPCGVLIWLFANLSFSADGASVLSQICAFFDPAARLFGLDGVIFFAFLLGLPANEIVIPIIMMTYIAGGHLTEYESIEQLKTIFIANGWNIKTAVCTCAFTLMHWPCATTLMTVARETKSVGKTVFAFAVPTFVGLFVCFLLNMLFCAIGY